MIKWILFIVMNIPIICFIPWIWYAWFNSPLDKFGPLWIICAVILLLLNFKYVKKTSDKKDYSALILIIFSIVFFIISLNMQINIFSLSAALILSMTSFWLLFGWTSFVTLFAVYAIAFLSFPTTTYIVGYLQSKINLPIMLNAELIKGIIIFLLLLIGLYYPRQKKFYLTKINGIYWCSVFIFLVLLIFYNSPTSEISDPLSLSIKTTPIDGWYGENCSLTNIEKKLFKGSDVKKYLFYNETGNVITIMNFKANDNLHSIHPPDYCLQGAGWKILKDNYISVDIKSKKYFIRKIIASYKHSKTIILSWYTSDSITTGDFKIFRLYQKSSIKSAWQSYLASININKNEDHAMNELTQFIKSNIKHD